MNEGRTNAPTAEARLIAGGYRSMSLKAVAQAIEGLYHRFPRAKNQLFTAVAEQRGPPA